MMVFKVILDDFDVLIYIKKNLFFFDFDVFLIEKYSRSQYETKHTWRLGWQLVLDGIFVIPTRCSLVYWEKYFQGNLGARRWIAPIHFFWGKLVLFQLSLLKWNEFPGFCLRRKLDGIFIILPLRCRRRRRPPHLI